MRSYPHCSVVQVWSSLLLQPSLVLLTVDNGERGHPDCSAAPYTKNSNALCTLTPFLSELASHFSAFGAKVAHVWDWIGQPFLPTCISEPIGGSPLFLPWTRFFLLPDIDYLIPGTPQKSCSFGDPLTQFSSRYNFSLIKLLKLKSLHLPISVLFTSFVSTHKVTFDQCISG